MKTLIRRMNGHRREDDTPHRFAVDLLAWRKESKRDPNVYRYPTMKSRLHNRRVRIYRFAYTAGLFTHEIEFEIRAA